MPTQPTPSCDAEAEMHNKIAVEIVSRILNETTGAGGSLSHMLVICESVIVGVVVECFKAGHDSKILDALFSAAKERLAKVRLDNLDTEGNA